MDNRHHQHSDSEKKVPSEKSGEELDLAGKQDAAEKDVREVESPKDDSVNPGHGSGFIRAERLSGHPIPFGGEIREGIQLDRDEYSQHRYNI